MDGLSDDIRSGIEAEIERRLQPLQGEILLLKHRVDHITAELEAVKSASESAKIAACDEEAKSPPKYPLGSRLKKLPLHVFVDAARCLDKFTHDALEMCSRYYRHLVAEYLKDILRAIRTARLQKSKDSSAPSGLFLSMEVVARDALRGFRKDDESEKVLHFFMSTLQGSCVVEKMEIWSHFRESHFEIVREWCDKAEVHIACQFAWRISYDDADVRTVSAALFGFRRIKALDLASWTCHGLINDEFLNRCKQRGVTKLRLPALTEEDYTLSEDALLAFCLDSSNSKESVRHDVSIRFSPAFIMRLIEKAKDYDGSIYLCLDPLPFEDEDAKMRFWSELTRTYDVNERVNAFNDVDDSELVIPGKRTMFLRFRELSRVRFLELRSSDVEPEWGPFL